MTRAGRPVPSTGTAPAAGGARGETAEHPGQIPPRGWRDVLLRVKAEAKDDQVSLMAAGVAFFGLLALVPALVAFLSLYGLLADPGDIERQVVDALAAAPAEVREVVTEQLRDIQSSSTGSGVVTVVIGLALALWSASGAMGHLVDAINRAYDEEETRGFVRRKGLSLLLTLGAIVFMVVALAVIAFLPSLIASTSLGAVGRWVIGGLRWVLLLLGGLAGLAVLYRYAPDRDNARWSWTSPGAIIATVVWLVASVLFSFYAANFGSYNETYGSLGAIVVLMLWLFITALAVILGAEINAELERQTARDTTEGREQPLGTRGAYAADTVAAGQP